MESKELELWAGIECTVNRVGNRFFDQLAKSGHDQRPEDLDRFAELGISAIRYPVLWERFQPILGKPIDWSWADERLSRLKERGMRPIVGLVHHGSGPSYTNLLDPRFPDLLAGYARQVAERFPWVVDYTPVNEPNTTARFSFLYGLWYPHGRDRALYFRGLVNECLATARAMREIRRVQPAARLVQTEDWGLVRSTPALAYQAAYENERRWLSFDLLCGRVVSGHPFRRRLAAAVGNDALDELAERPSPPDVVGINYYVISDRFLDDRVEAYPEALVGGNGSDAYADVEAVRSFDSGLAGHASALRSAWDRYHIPVAITEVHLDGTREEQLRWLSEAWEAARTLRREGVDVRAVTAWALLGLYDWNSLVTRETGYYEPGVFDLRGSRPRPTALAKMVKALATEGRYDHPVLAGPGWWRRRSRALYPPSPDARGETEDLPRDGAPILIAGARGTLGYAFAHACRTRGLPYRLLTRSEMDICSPESVRDAIARLRPWCVVNAAGYVNVDEAERDPGECFNSNASGAENLARACREFGARFLTFSSDLVFDGRNGDRPYVESDPVSPLNVYGHSKVDAERRTLAADPDALVVRTSSFFGPWDDANFLTKTLLEWKEGRSVLAARDVIMTATYVPDLVSVCLDLLIDGESGIWHLTHPEPVSWAEFAHRFADLAGFPSHWVDVRESASLEQNAARPKWSALGSERGILMPPLEDSMRRYLRDLEAEWLDQGRGAVSAPAERTAR